MSDLIERLRPRYFMLSGMKQRTNPTPLELEAADEIERLRAELAARDWQPIETAPKDWTHVLVVDDGTVGEARWTDDGWYWGSDHSSNPWSCLLNPTHWMPLPAAPSGTKENSDV